MADVHSKLVRSYNMSRIRSVNTKPELTVRKALFANGFRFRIHDQKLPGKPDIVLKKYKTVIFINGCFWHGHNNCKYYMVPKTRTEWWLQKINATRSRDQLSIRKLKDMKWKVITIYECSLKGNKLETSIKKIISQLKID
jgi:DNA mismatch endonuclease (patch repair protein)